MQNDKEKMPDKGFADAPEGQIPPYDVDPT